MIDVQVSLCQKLLFLHLLTHNMKTDCSLNSKFNTWKFQAQNMGWTYCVQKLFFTFRTVFVHNMFSPCSAKISSSEKNFPGSKSGPHFYFKIFFLYQPLLFTKQLFAGQRTLTNAKKCRIFSWEVPTREAFFTPSFSRIFLAHLTNQIFGRAQKSLADQLTLGWNIFQGKVQVF